MSLHKFCFLTLLAMIVCAAAGNLDRRLGEFDTRPHGSTLGADKTIWWGQPRNNPDRSLWVEGVRAGSKGQLPLFLPVQSRNVKDLTAGKVLVASRSLGDPNFAETVLLLVHYEAKGVVGLILNRRTQFPVSRVLEGIKAAKDRSDRVYLGGPVDTPAVFALFRPPSKLEGAEQVFAGVYLISDKNLFEQAISSRPDPGAFHVYLGYAGWDDNQLRKEVELGAWFIFPGDASTVFNSDPDSLWPEMIRKTELKMAGNEPADADSRTIAGTSAVPNLIQPISWR